MQSLTLSATDRAPRHLLFLDLVFHQARQLLHLPSGVFEIRGDGEDVAHRVEHGVRRYEGLDAAVRMFFGHRSLRSSPGD